MRIPAGHERFPKKQEREHEHDRDNGLTVGFFIMRFTESKDRIRYRPRARSEESVSFLFKRPRKNPSAAIASCIYSEHVGT